MSEEKTLMAGKLIIQMMENDIKRLTRENEELTKQLVAVTKERNQFQDQCISRNTKESLRGEAS